MALGLGVLDPEPIVVGAARPMLESEAHALDETFLAGHAADASSCSTKSKDPTCCASRRSSEEIPVHTTAVGKLYLAFAPDA